MFFNSQSLLFAASIYLVAALTVQLYKPALYFGSTSGRFESIDGLRGFLALGVFIHHSAVWWTFVSTGSWTKPESYFYIHLGETTVALFFMITAFLFTNKILTADPLNTRAWLRLLSSRVFRLFPMYVVSIVVLLFIALASTGFLLQVSLVNLGTSFFHWICFGITRQPLVNNFELTNYINAGVIWSLRLEWLFYFFLPIMALIIVRKINSVPALIVSVVFVTIYLVVHGIRTPYILSFLGGSLAAGSSHLVKDTRVFKTKTVSVIVILLLGTLGLYSTADSVMAKIIIFAIFALIALGNDLFGLLTSATMKMLGEVCYSTYLIHGIILFVLLHVLIGDKTVLQMGQTNYCFIVIAITPVVVLVSCFCFFTIEKRWIQKGKQFSIRFIK